MPKDTNYPCTYCEFTSKHKSHVARHIKAVHDKRRDHKCSMCDYAAGRRETLSSHIKFVHEKIRDIGCQHCDLKFVQQQDLTRHLRTVHTQIKEFKCTICGRQFGRNDNLQKHIRAIHQKDKSNTHENVQDRGDHIKNHIEAERQVMDESDFMGREHTCQICGSKFKGIELTRHFMVQCAPSESHISN